MPNTHPRQHGTFRTLWVTVILFVAGLALAQPVEREGIWRTPELVELAKADSTIKLDIRYATSNNFMKRTMYAQARVFLQRPVAESLTRAHRILHRAGYGILVFDGYRPWSVTKAFWDQTPRSKRMFVANPKQGSKHNRGCAVDCSLYDVRTGKEIEMPSPYDDFTERAAANYSGGTDEQRRTRSILRKALEAEGFTVNPTEWWHFDHKDWKRYRVMDVPFEKLR
jgi:zinc D-Ala-D-Ala dipeptidase